MKSKIRTIIALGIIGVVVLGMTLIILLNGSKNGGFNYARIDCGISVEFVTNNKGNVVAYRPLNNDARFALAGLDIEGEKIKKVIDNVLEDSFKMGYLDLNAHIVPIQITTIGGVTHSFDMRVYETVNDFLVRNQIMGLIVENTNDMTKIREAKEMRVSANELMLIKSITHSNSIPIKQLSKKMPDELIDIVMDIDDYYVRNNPILESDKREKINKIESYSDVYKLHMSRVSIESAREYSEKRVKMKREYQRKLELGHKL